MNSSGYQAPEHASMVLPLPLRRVVWAGFRWRQRLSLRGVSLEAARLTAVDSGHRSWRARMERLVEHLGGVRTEVLRVFEVRHFRPLVCRVWHGNWHTCPTSTAPLIFGLTGRPKVGKLAMSGYESVPPIRIWLLNESPALSEERGFRAFKPTSEYTLALTDTQFHIIFASFAICICFAHQAADCFSAVSFSKVSTGAVAI